jgi:hypothetical protein
LNNLPKVTQLATEEARIKAFVRMRGLKNEKETGKSAQMEKKRIKGRGAIGYYQANTHLEAMKLRPIKVK